MMTIAVSADRELALPPAERRRIAHAIQMELARRSMPRKHLVAESGLSASTIDKALAGQFSQATLARIDAVMGTCFAGGGTLAPGLRSSGEIAPVELGAYTRLAVSHYVGSYLTIRPAFAERGRIVAFSTEMAWDDAQSCLVFSESDKPDRHHEHRGRVAIPTASSHIYLVSLTKGSMRMVLLSQLGPKGEMRGLISTLANPVGPVYMPAAAPIVYLKCADMGEHELGYLSAGCPSFERYRAILKETVEKSHIAWGEP